MDETFAKGGAGIRVIVHAPAGGAERAELARRVAAAHSDAVLALLREAPCPAAQKLALLRELTKDGPR